MRSATMALKGKLFGADGEPMSPSFTHKGETKVYRYYVSAPLQQGRAMREAPDALRRVAADEIEGLIERELRRRCCQANANTSPDMAVGP